MIMHNNNAYACMHAMNDRSLQSSVNNTDFFVLLYHAYNTQDRRRFVTAAILPAIFKLTLCYDNKLQNKNIFPGGF